ncbi:hypothetical protein L202_02606 [Cryptococcus amylolentus CBS 6039]|uniref:Uncharacterized protein n=1 Tax=Cryptococcus amylolentus CBS 6039 TaxID=1295533 RepID=A0A1E3HX49_9TREE|nr:hypothetical protein L202_02606 [Cryptococcus amylolentus CBS 6039]ODN80346.1 hypothetical protein L202_02606 [Cryptococcus amylolentus CBS 6039]
MAEVIARSGRPLPAHMRFTRLLANTHHPYLPFYQLPNTSMNHMHLRSSGPPESPFPETDLPQSIELNWYNYNQTMKTNRDEKRLIKLTFCWISGAPGRAIKNGRRRRDFPPIKFSFLS